MSKPNLKIVVPAIKPKAKVKYSDPEFHDVALDDHGDEQWLISFADLMTLLFGFFVILTAFSTPNPKKFEQLKKLAAKEMKVKYENPYENISAELKNVLRNFNLENEISIEEQDAGLALVSKGTLFFDLASSELKPQAHELLTKVGNLLASNAKNFFIVVEGHTDNIPIRTKVFPSNWELSATRASTVVRLLEAQGVVHEKLRSIGFADLKPLVPNLDTSGSPLSTNQAQNRRIVIRLQKGV